MKNKMLFLSSKTILEFVNTHVSTIVLALIFVLFLMYVILKIRAKKNSKFYETMLCTVYTSRGNPLNGEKEKFLKDVEVRWYKEKNLYIFRNSNTKWYILRNYYINQIINSKLKDGTPSFDMPKKLKKA